MKLHQFLEHPRRALHDLENARRGKDTQLRRRRHRPEVVPLTFLPPPWRRREA
jgi:hypothetical protein